MAHHTRTRRRRVYRVHAPRPAWLHVRESQVPVALRALEALSRR
jgi:hypothetical protein